MHRSKSGGRLPRARRERPRNRRAAEQRDELAPFQLIELHSIPLPAVGVRFASESVIRQSPQCPDCSRKRLFDHLVGARENRDRHVEAERLRGPKIDHQLELGGVLDRQIGSLFAFENTINIRDRAPIEVVVIDTVRGQSAALDEITESIHSREPGGGPPNR